MFYNYIQYTQHFVLCKAESQIFNFHALNVFGRKGRVMMCPITEQGRRKVWGAGGSNVVGKNCPLISIGLPYLPKNGVGGFCPPPTPAALLQQIQSIPIASLISDFGFHESTINKIGSQIFFAFNLIEKFIVKSKFTRVTEAFWSWICVRYIKNKMQVYFFSILHKQNHHEIISYWIKIHVQPKKHFGPFVNLKSLNSMTILEGHSVNWVGFLP